MSSDQDMNAIVKRWRAGVKSKFRGIASFEERAQLRFDAIKAAVFPQHETLNAWRFRQGRYLGLGQYDYASDWTTINIGDTWGGDDVTAFFEKTMTVPDAFAGKKIALLIYLGGDSLLSVNGKPYHGLDVFRNEVPLSDSAAAGETFEISIESYMQFQHVEPRTNAFMDAQLVTIDQELRDAYWDLWVVSKMLAIPDVDVSLSDFIETNLWDAMKGIPLQEADAAHFRQCVLDAAKQVRDTVYATDRFKGEGLMSLVGHSHLDVVYMWPHREYLRKVGRTHATMLRLMEAHPQFIFAQSQAKIYADMKEHFPHLFEQVKQRITEGRWEPIGAFWIEPDCNLVSGESFVRHILHGQRFFKEEFGITSRTCWQPDVFGLSWAMPQILARSGVKYFLTNKMVPWNDTNPWNLNNFWWEGMDGSRVLGIVPPGHFIGTVDPDVVATQWRNFADKSTIGQTLHIYGWGDGGGGVDLEMLESAKRYQDFPGLPRMAFSKAEDAFDKIAEKADALPEGKLPVLRDEIYLEAHRGTYTTKGRLKKLNRRSELLYRDAELLAAFAWAGGADWPAEQLDTGWKMLLNAQFHDAVPGTHVPPVYDDLKADYEKIREVGQAVCDVAFAHLVGVRPGNDIVVFNSLPHEREDLVAVPAAMIEGKTLADANGKALPQQEITDLDGTQRRLVAIDEIAPVSFHRLVPLPRERTGGGSFVSVTDLTLENALLRATFNERGQLVSLLDKPHGRESLIEGQAGNVFQLFEDTPGKYDAWDIVETYQDHPIDIGGDVTVTLDESGPLRASLRIERTLGQSKLTQRVSLEAGRPHLVFETQIDWVERQRLLKVAFPVEINANSATYDIAYGNIARATQPRNPYEQARFEVSAHQWMDLSQADYGLSILNDGKYGCDVRGKVMRLTLLKGSIHPDPQSDMETHHFRYALYPHTGDWRQAKTIQHAAAFNVPCHVWPMPPESSIELDTPLLRLDAQDRLTLEAVKVSEDGQDLIIRVVDRHNALTHAKLSLSVPVAEAWSCDLMENKESPLEIKRGEIEFTVKPYEIVTIRVAVER